MNLLSWFKSSQSNQPQKHIHSKITHYCCSDNCLQPQICNQCYENHNKSHRLMIYKQFTYVQGLVMKQIRWRKQIEDTILELHQNLIAQFQNILQKQANKFLSEIDQEIYSKNFREIYKRDLVKKNYNCYLPDFKRSIGQQVNNLLQKTVKQKKKNIIEQFKLFIVQNRTSVKQFINLGLPKIGLNPSLSKTQKLKGLLPFSCRLTSKFQASAHSFQTDKLHKLAIRGPILIIAESYKGKIFGGFSPKMFPKTQVYQQDNRCRSFLFSLDRMVRLPIKQQYNKFAIKGGSNLWFGRGDLVIADQCNKANISWAQIGRAYQLPPGVTGNTDQWLAGALYFQVVQYQIYQVQQINYFTK